MKIKLLGISEDEKAKGFNVGDVCVVDKVEISGDCYAYDIFYKCGDMWFHSILSEEVSSDIRVDMFIKHVDNLIAENSKNEVLFKFKYELDLNSFCEDNWIACSNDEGLIISTNDYGTAFNAYEWAKSGLQFKVDDDGVFDCDEVAILGKVFRSYQAVPVDDDSSNECFEYEENILCTGYDSNNTKWLVWNDDDGISTITDDYEEALNDYSKMVKEAKEYSNETGEVYEETKVILARMYKHFYSKKIGFSEEDDCEIWDFKEEELVNDNI